MNYSNFIKVASSIIPASYMVAILDLSNYYTYVCNIYICFIYTYTTIANYMHLS